LELRVGHTFGFVIFSSVVLLALFFFDLNMLVVGLFSISATAAVASVVILPALQRL
ncbi:unnamed protein product, partial [Discosporangium mesarthrocarpum]